ncbi:MAG: methyltransferase domain-containing protein [Deltaproteobacteria bacterium]|nr:MAG: methyltransferase domain-containing protein [Deltaproteobacteria bacterium]
MRDDVKAFVALAARLFDVPAPIVEIGSLQTAGQEGYADLRALFPGKAYLGCDLVAGPGVDRVEDAEALGFADASVGTIVAAESLEHVADPYRAVAEMHRVVRPGGLVIIAAPFIFPIHHEPDFTRFTPEGLRRLLSVFPVATAYAQGDAQWPHTVYGLAAKAGEAEERARFVALASRIADEWERAGVHDPLRAFVPVSSAMRRDSGDTRLERLAAGGSLEQTFECPRAGLCRIDVKLDTGGGGRPLTRLTLFSEGDLNVPVASSVTRPVWGNQRWVAFAFPSIADSAGRRYVFRLECPDATPEAWVAAHVARDGSLSFEVFAGRPETPARARHEPTSLPSTVLSDGERVMLATSRELADAMRRLLAATERQTAELGRMRDQHRTALAQLSEQMLKLELGLEAVRNRHRSWLRRLLGR